MCGIFGYIGTKTNAASMAIEGLKNLEYRGYDSWGVAWKEGNELSVRKDIGKISGVDPTSLPGCCRSRGHTRWATHGGVTVANADPQLNKDKTSAVVHNGIVENYQELREELKAKGHHFVSETDTEVIPHVIEEELKLTKDF